MKKLFTFAAMMLVTVFTFVACNKDKSDPKPTWETPTSLTGTEWTWGSESSFLYTLIFETETTGKKLSHNNSMPDGEKDSERTFSYTYDNGSGQYKDDNNDTYTFTIDGGELTEVGASNTFTYNRKK